MELETELETGNGRQVLYEPSAIECVLVKAALSSGPPCFPYTV